MRKSIITILGVMLMALFIGTAFADPWETYRNTAYSRSDVVIGPTFDFTTSATGTTTFTNGATIPTGEVLTGDVTGTASRIAVGTFIGTAYGLKNSTANKAQVNLSANMGLRLGTGATAGSIEIYPGHGIDVGASGVEVDPDDFRDPLSGLVETTSNHLGVNLTANKGLEFGTGAASGSLQINLDGTSLALGVGGISVNPAQELTSLQVSGPTYLNGTTIGSGDALDITSVDKLKVATVIVPVYETITFPITNQSVDEYAFIADDAWWLVKAEEIHSVAGTAVAPTAANLTVRICDDNEAPSAGINSTTAVIPLNDAVNNINTASLNNTICLLADGDMIALDYAGDLAAVRGSVTLTLRRM